MGVGRRKLAPLWALALTLAWAQHTGEARGSSVEHGHEYLDLLPVTQGPAGDRLRGVTILPPLRTAPVVRALNPAHNGRVCSTWGDFHYKTFDGDVFRFPGLCNYVLSAHCGAAYEDFNVQVRRGLESNVTTLARVTMKLDGMVIELTKSSIQVNGLPIQLPFSQSGVIIEHSSSHLKVVARLGLVFMWSQDDSLLLELDAKYSNQTCGLCGDFNGVPVFDEFLSHGVKLTPIEFGNLQKLHGPTEQCQDPAPVPPLTCSLGTGICEEILSSWPFRGCNALVDASSYVQACRQDLCLCEHAEPTSCVCHTVAEYSRQCAHAGGRPLDWRGPDLITEAFWTPGSEGPPKGRAAWGGGLVSSTCSRVAAAWHLPYWPPASVGTVLDDIGHTGCIPAPQCACVYNGATYAPGAVYSTDCANCTCSSGRWSCQEVPCPGTCSVLGGAHFSTFDERQYTVHGDCSYVLAKPCDSSAFTVLAELRRCGLTDSETCLKSLTLSLDGGHTVIVVKASGEVFVNQIYTQMPVSAANVTLFRPSTFFIIAQTNLGLQLDIQLVPTMQVFLRLAPELRGLTCGLCGNFNQNQADDFRTLSGVVEGTAAAFANTWKTQAACPNVKNSFEDPCSLSVENEKYAQHWCSRLKDPHGPFAQCHAAVSPGTYHSNCMFDTCNCQKSEDCLCAALSSYVHACAAKGVLLRGWRDGVCTKPMATCPKSLTYQYHISSCQPTCRARSHEDVTCGIRFVPVDGCACPQGTFMDEAGKCVPASSCPCYHEGSVVPNGESLHERGAICTCTQGLLSCIGGHTPAPVCTPPMVYVDCRNATPGAAGAGCQKSCLTLDMECYSPRCEPGCVCPDGLVADGEGGCVAVEDCPCVHDEASYLPGQTVRVGCNTCTCKSRMWQCTREPCLATCTVYGDGHYITFDGRSYSFSGDCAYTLLQDHCGGNSTANGTFRVVTENVPCGTTGVTCSKDLKLFLGSYELKLSGGKVEVIQKGVGQEAPYSIRQMGIYLVVDTEVGLVLLWDRKTSIFLKLSPAFKGRVCGLCGNFDDNAVNDFTTRSQSVVGNALEFGNSWKFSPSCADAPAPRDACAANPHRKSWAQKQCSVLNSATFAACHAHVEPAKYYEACVGDACACDSGGDCECLCTAVAAYAQACHDVGVCVSWRTPDICPLFCDYYNREGQCEWHYQPCGPPCMRTCRNPSGRCLTDLPGLEGCYPKCPPEAPIFDEDRMQCVATCPTPPPPPPCRVQGKSYRPGEMVPSDRNCQSCVCRESGVQCAYDTEACVCTYDGRRFRPGDVIYHTTDGTGGCISARCSANGTIDRRVYPCSPTTPTPPTTFSFSTPPLVVSSTRPAHTCHSPAKSTVRPSTRSGAPSSTPGTTSGPPTSPPRPRQACGEDCRWSPWLDVSHPGRGIDSGDFDTLENLRAHGHQVCPAPKRVECRAEDAPEVPIQVLGQHVECSPARGLTCYNRKQASGLCHNYQIRVQCCFPRTCPTSGGQTQTTTPVPGTTTTTPSTPTPVYTCPRDHYDHPEYLYSYPRDHYDHPEYVYTCPRDHYDHPEYPYTCPRDHYDHPEYPYTCPRYHYTCPRDHYDHPEYLYTYPRDHYDHPEYPYTCPRDHYDHPEYPYTCPRDHYDHPEYPYTCPRDHYDHPEYPYTCPRDHYDHPEYLYSCPNTSTPVPSTPTPGPLRPPRVPLLLSQVPLHLDHYDHPEYPYTCPRDHYDHPEYPYTCPRDHYDHPEYLYSCPKYPYTCPRDHYNHPEYPYTCPRDHYDHPKYLYSCPKYPYTCPRDHYNHPEYPYTCPRDHYDHPEYPYTCPRDHYDHPEYPYTCPRDHYDHPKYLYTCPRDHYDHPEYLYSCPKYPYTCPRDHYNHPEYPYTCPRDQYNHPKYLYSCPKYPYTCPRDHYNHPEYPYTCPRDHYDHPKYLYSYPRDHYNHPEYPYTCPRDHYNHPEYPYTRPRDHYDHPEYPYTCPRDHYDHPEYPYTCPRDHYDHPEYLYTCPRTTTTVENTPLTPRPMTVSTTPEPCLQKLCNWTQWFDSSYPDPGINGGDFDTFHDLRAKGHKFCEKPSNVECRAQFFPNIPLEELGQDLICDKSLGLLCLNRNQLPPICYNYEIRIECCELVDVCRSTTHPVTSETTYSTREEPGTQTQLTWTTRIPSSPTRHSTASSVHTHPTTSITTGTHSVSPAVTIPCQPQCTWTKWFDVDFPSPGPHGGDAETFGNIIRRGEKICRRPEYITRLECRAESHPEVSIETLGQVVECNVSKGLVCRNRDQGGDVGMCLNYEVRVLCCEPPEHCSTHKTVGVPHTSSISTTRLTETTSHLVTSSSTSVPKTSSTSVTETSPTSVTETSSTSVTETSSTSITETRNQLNLGDRDQANFGDRNQANLGDRDQPNFGDRDQLNLSDKNQANLCDRNQLNLGDRDQPNLGDRNQLNLSDRNQANLGDRNQPNLGDRDQANLGDRDQLNLGDRDQPNLGDRNQLNLGDRNQANLGDRNQTNLGDRDQANLGDRNQPNLGDKNQANLGDRNQLNLGDRDQANLGDRNQPNLGDRNQANLGDRNQLNLGDRDQPNLGDRDQPNLGDKNQANLGDRNQLNLGDRNQANLGDRNQPNLGDRNQANLGDRNQPNLGDRNQANLGDRNQLNLGDRDQPNLGDRDQLNLGDRNQANLGDRNQTNLGDRNQANLGDRDQANLGDRNQPNLGDRNQANLGDRNQTNLGDRDQPNLGDRDQPNLGDRDQANLGDRNQPNLGDKNQANLGDRNQLNLGDRDQPNLGDRNQLDLGDGNQLNLGDRNQLNLGDRNQANFGDRDQPNLGDRDQPNLGDRNQLNLSDKNQANLCDRNQPNLSDRDQPNLGDRDQPNLETSSTSVTETSPTSVTETSPTSVTETRPTSVTKTSPTSEPKRSTTSGPTMSTSPVLKTETTHFTPVTIPCQPQCRWTKWFDVDFPSPGRHGGDADTLGNIVRRGGKICRRPEYITRLECRAESHPEVSIETLGQVVECNVSKGLMCRNRDQSGDVGMCNYEVRVLCCEPPEHCPRTSVTPYATPSTKPSSPPEPTSVVSTTTCYCSVSDKFYRAGSIIYNRTDLDGHCYYATCGLDCHVVRTHYTCASGTTPPVPTASPAGSSPSASAPVTAQGCPNAVPPRRKGETWAMPNCSQATCEGNGVITLQPRPCPQVQRPVCANGYPPVKVVDPDSCCPHYRCQCVCSGWGDPHYITFDGTYYTFLDNCTYVLVQQILPVYGHFRVLIDNYFCGAEDGLSCPQSIIVEYRQDRVVLTHKPVLGVMTNEIIFNDKVVKPGFQKDGVSVSQIGIKMYLTIPELGVQVMFSGLIFSVELPFSKFANNTEGQCGTCTNDKKDECRLPGGTVVPSCSDMSGHWKVTTPHQPPCHGPPPEPTAVGPTPSPAPCLPSPICQLILSEVFELCHPLIPPLAFYQGCTFDHCHLNDSNVLCSSLELYASLCASRGVCIDWRRHTNHMCSFTCPADKVYLPCGPSKPSYCYGSDNTSLVALQDTVPITEGCFCPENMTRFSMSSPVCVPADCHRCLGPHGEAVEPGHTISVDCQRCTCESSTLTMSCHRQPCPLPPACPLPGFVPVPAAPQAGQCCPQYNCACDTSYCPKPVACPEGSHPVVTYTEGACCPSQNCSWAVCSVNGTLYQPGSVVSSSLCETCRCEVSSSPQLDTVVISCETQICNTHCPAGFEYQEQSGQCCGLCVQQTCVVNTSDSSTRIFYPGQSWPDPTNPCVTHECEKHRDGLVVVTRKKACPPLNCPAAQAQLSEDGCCLACPPPQPPSQSACAVYYKREVIVHGDCRSPRPMRVAYCQGNCGDSSAKYSLEANTIEQNCSCCRELRVSPTTVTLRCKDGSSRTFGYTLVKECGCVGQRCGPRGNLSRSEGPGPLQSDEEQSQETGHTGWRRGSSSLRSSRPPPSGTQR
ncbi:LOW QUALITY PROTEIN: mucin-5AC [Acinonyx jubatus]|uniref:LOW QUALITY PROTEIN: mucin-5AC n=1 Tax=Acinonyx jubatus TaxID=32536 RepID=A0ABM3NGS9_ACIJB|nr:LOW QUALITY PROTEIN: mucin-5AC [Acinonyx jubatus]